MTASLDLARNDIFKNTRASGANPVRASFSNLKPSPPYMFDKNRGRRPTSCCPGSIVGPVSWPGGTGMPAGSSSEEAEAAGRKGDAASPGGLWSPFRSRAGPRRRACSRPLGRGERFHHLLRVFARQGREGTVLEVTG